MRKIFFLLAAIVSLNLMATEGALRGKFSVSATKQIVFSQGNLQYQPSTETFRFAEQQYHFVGDDTQGNVYVETEKSNNENVRSSYYKGWADIFSWGTGDRPAYHSDNNDDFATYNEWGAQPISNGGNAANLWRTLTEDEWDYLADKRLNADSLKGLAIVEGVKCALLFPDNFNEITDVPFIHKTEDSETNTLTTDQWNALEKAGVVCLPLGGWSRVYMGSYTLDEVQYGGLYWSSTKSGNSAGVMAAYADDSDFGLNGTSYVCDGCAVRLVQDIVPMPEPLSGKFTVAEGKQIQFSKGNLQYHCKNHVWQFAENQYDTIGGANTNIADDYNGWIDLFGWGTGNNPTLATNPADDYSTFTDWGTRIGEPDEWRTLTDDEMEYLLHTRSTTLFGMGTVNNVKGLFILPDNWTDPKPNGVSFNPSTEHGLNYEDHGAYSNHGGTDNFSWNAYTKDDWEAMEAAGAVFLPTAGYRIAPAEGEPITKVVDVNVVGVYWTSGTSGSDALAFYFNKTALKSHWYFARQRGYSVRLVHDYDPGSATAIDKVNSSNTQAVKLLKQGNLYILRNGKMYDVTGKEVK